jgi:rhodanese-related sulfurtransferase
MTGNPNAAVTVVEWGDLECPSCGLEQPTVRELRQKYADRIRFVFRHFPLTGLHPQAEKAAEASECAAEQGRFWEALDKIYAEQNDLSEPALMRDAADLGLDQSRFKQCLESGATAVRVRRDMEDARALHVDRTPSFFVNDRVITGQIPLEQFSQVIDLELRSRGSFAQLRSQLEKREKPDARPPTQPSGQLSGTKAQSGDGQTASDPSSAAGPTGLLGQNPADAFSQYQPSGIACSEEEANKRQPTLVRTDEAAQLFHDRSRVLFVDVRPTGDFRGRHIRGAVNMPAQEIPQRWSALPRDRTIVFYESGRSAGDVCASGRAAGRILLEHGFSAENVKVYQDGLAGWEHARLPIER